MNSKLMEELLPDLIQDEEAIEARDVLDALERLTIAINECDGCATEVLSSLAKTSSSIMNYEQSVEIISLFRQFSCAAEKYISSLQKEYEDVALSKSDHIKFITAKRRFEKEEQSQMLLIESSHE